MVCRANGNDMSAANIPITENIISPYMNKVSKPGPGETDPCMALLLHLPMNWMNYKIDDVTKLFILLHSNKLISTNK